MKTRLKPLGMLVIVFAILIAWIVYLGIYHEPKEEKSLQTPGGMFEMGIVKTINLTIVYDNNPYDSRLKTAWGFGCLVEMKDITLLFDTGGNPSILLSNMAILKVDLSQIQIIVLSHAHGDHTGGLSGILEQNNHLKVYIPASFSNQFKKGVRAYGCEIIEITAPVPICDGVATTGELGTSIKEQSLLVNTSAGLVLITGCAHPGIVNIVRTAKELTNREIYLVLGGFHLGSVSENQLLSIIQDFKDLDVQNVAPCHCSGTRARQLFHTHFGIGYIEAGVGTTIKIDVT